jgi:hypothetical protein
MEHSLVAGFEGGGQHPDLLFFALGHTGDKLVQFRHLLRRRVGQAEQ